jgi:hypothetical protein
MICLHGRGFILEGGVLCMSSVKALRGFLAGGSEVVSSEASSMMSLMKGLNTCL